MRCRAFGEEPDDVGTQLVDVIDVIHAFVIAGRSGARYCFNRVRLYRNADFTRHI
jgi:hypothetical protein